MNSIDQALRNPVPHVFEYTRAVGPTDKCFEPDVYYRDGDPLTEHGMFGVLTSFVPLTVAAPAVQGKGSLVAYCESLIRNKAEWLPIQGDGAAWLTASAFLDSLSQRLECRRGTITLAQALETSERLADLRRRAAATVLLLDLSRCRVRAVTEWVMASVGDIDREVDLLAWRLQIVVVTGHSQLDPACAPQFPTNAGAVAIANFTEEQSDRLLTRAARATSPTVFEPDARKALFERTRGDKYYTNLLASFCQKRAGETKDRGEPAVVTETTVKVAAQLLAGSLAHETRILPGFARAIAERDDVAQAVEMLCGDGEAWAELSPGVRAALEDMGVVGPAWAHPGQPALESSRRPEVRVLRNPMVRDLAIALLAARRSSGLAPADPQARPPGPPSGGASDAAPVEPQTSYGPLRSFLVGETEYVFRRPLFGDYSPQQMALTVRGLRAFEPGHGASAEEAFRNWTYRFHFMYHKLSTKNVTDMRRREKQAFEEIEEMADLKSMQKKRAVTLREIGVITQVRRAGITFTWEDGTRDTIPLEVLPEECVGFPRGQRVEAIVRREESSFKILRVLHTQALPDLPPMTEEEADELWNSLPGASTRPEASWD